MTCFVACGAFESPNNEYKPLSLSTKAMEYVSEGNDFSLGFTQNVASSSKSDFVVSPLSLQFVLGMLLEGADGRTADEICEVLGYGAGESAEVGEFCKSMLEQLPEIDRATKLNIANAILLNQDYSMLPSYKKGVANYYEAYVENADFGSPLIVGRINSWCKRNTNGMIPKIIDTLDPDAFAVLLNAIYFNGKWTSPFEKSMTGSEKFKKESGASLQVPMMKKNRLLAYTWNDVFQAVRLPYGNGAYSLTVCLPLDGYTVADILPVLEKTGWRQFCASMSSYNVDLWLPRFETAFSMELTDMLAAMGMPAAFTAAADFSKMTETSVCVSEILQKAIIKVSEEGTEAAAVTIGTMKATSAAPDPERNVDFHADHPFLYFISEQSSGAILFTGRYGGEPAAE